MNDSKLPEGFLGYIEVPGLHDGAIVEVQESSDSVRVAVRGASGKHLAMEFFGVADIVLNQPEGMTLLGLAEVKQEGTNRKFVFLNWDEKDPAKLEIIASDFSLMTL
jgi:hypothetical protein